MTEKLLCYTLISKRMAASVYLDAETLVLTFSCVVSEQVVFSSSSWKIILGMQTPQSLEIP